jgi:hypothetical protein
MAKSIRGNKKRRGRPKTTGIGVQIGMRWHPPILDEIDAWASRQADSPSRPEAIRRLVELGLASGRPAARPSAKKAARARQLAAETIDRLTDPTAPAEEQAKRMRRLTKGPAEFREMRADLPKAKR